jgi:DNA modification methylase
MISYQFYEGDSYDILNRWIDNPKERGKYRLIVTSPPY